MLEHVTCKKCLAGLKKDQEKLDKQLAKPLDARKLMEWIDYERQRNRYDASKQEVYDYLEYELEKGEFVAGS